MGSGCALEPKPCVLPPFSTSMFLPFPGLALTSAASPWILPGPASQQHPGLDPSDPSTCSSSISILTRLGSKPDWKRQLKLHFPHTSCGMKTFLVHIKEWEECDLKGAEDLTWHCCYHLVSQKKVMRAGSPRKQGQNQAAQLSGYPIEPPSRR